MVKDRNQFRTLHRTVQEKKLLEPLNDPRCITPMVFIGNFIVSFWSLVHPICPPLIDVLDSQLYCQFHQSVLLSITEKTFFTSRIWKNSSD